MGASRQVVARAATLWMMDSPQQLVAGVLPPWKETPGEDIPEGKIRKGVGRGKRRDRPVTTSWAFARPTPALLTAVHSYAPSSALEARGISQLLFPDSL